MTSSAINDAIRRAAGRNVAPAARERELEQPVGSIGIGRGASAAARPPASTSADVNARIRAGARLARGFTVPGGVNIYDLVDLDDVLDR
jgi:hypothetical protein